MRYKSELYKKEQEKLCDKIIDILELDANNQITLYELDTNKTKTEKIIDLIPDLRKYFSYNNSKGIGEPEKVKRPWLSIIRHVTKIKYSIINKDYRIYESNKVIRTIIYTFAEK